MDTQRAGVDVAVLKDDLYSVGGNLLSLFWCSCAKFLVAILGSVIHLNFDSGLYCFLISGILGSSPLQTVEKLDIRANKWVYVAKMSIPRVDAGAGSISLM